MKKFIFPLLVLIILAGWYFYKSNKTEYYKVSGEAQGTTYSIIYGAKNGLDLSQPIAVLLDSFDQTFSSYIPQSIISRINNNDPKVETNKLFNYILTLSKDINEQTQGAFDLTVAPLVNAWGFGWKNNDYPDQQEIDSILQFVGMDKIKVEGVKVEKSDPRVQIDVNAIAQGYSVDVVADFLEDKGIINYLVEIGGELKTSGKKANGSIWRIGIERPTENNDMGNRPIQAAVELDHRSLATSGNYRKFYEKNGMKIVHTINPKTGKTIQSNLLSATVLTDECATADALATSFMVLGVDGSIELLKTMSDVDAYFIYSDSTGNFMEWASEGFDKLLEGESEK